MIQVGGGDYEGPCAYTHLFFFSIRSSHRVLGCIDTTLEYKSIHPVVFKSFAKRDSVRWLAQPSFHSKYSGRHPTPAPARSGRIPSRACLPQWGATTPTSSGSAASPSFTHACLPNSLSLCLVTMQRFCDQIRLRSASSASPLALYRSWRAPERVL